MNVIFLDIDGVLITIHSKENEDIEKRIKILKEICEENNCKIVISSSLKNTIDEETMETNNEFINYILNCFKKYNIECIGRTPTVEKKKDNIYYISTWKEDEIRLYLYKHPEIKHYCIIDDDDLAPNNSDLNKVRKHLVKTIYYSNNKEEEGLLEEHKNKIQEILKLENEISKLINIKKRNNTLKKQR